uniref:Inositol 1,4,5-triphosphate receptor associated 1 n=1 Tax=Pogona vitticeps TaxID=103695 RepID=A0A6J0THD0_9SAUR
MSLCADCSEDDLINVTFEVCNTKEREAVPASVFIKYLEDVTGHNHENSKLLLLYNMLDPARQNVLVDRKTFHATMKKWITICYQDGISETEPEKHGSTTNQKFQCNVDMISSISDEGVEIFEGRAEDSEMACDLSSSIEDLKYMNQKMTKQLLKMQKVVGESEETCLQLRDDVAELRDRLASMQKPLGKFKYIYKELEDTRNGMANLNEENHMICECITRLKKSVEFLTTKLNSLEENAKTHKEGNPSVCETSFPHSWEPFQNFLQEIKSQKDSMLKSLMEEMELKQKMDHSLAVVTQALYSLCPFIKTWNKVLENLETLLQLPQFSAKLACFNMEVDESSEPNRHVEQNILQTEIQASSDYMVNCIPCCFDRANRNYLKEHPGTTSATLQTVDKVSFNKQMLGQTEEKDQVLVQSQKKLLGAGKRWNPDGKLETMLEIAKNLAKDKNTMSDEKRDTHIAFSEHNICPEPTKGNDITASRLKEPVFNILKEICESTTESSITNLYVQQMIQAFYPWLSKDEGSFLFQDYTEDHLKIGKPVSGFTKSAEPTNGEDNGSATLVGTENIQSCCFSVVQQWLINQQTTEKGNGRRMLFLEKDDKYSVQEELMLDMKNRSPCKVGAPYSKTTFVLPVYSPSVTSSAAWLLDSDASKLQTSLIDALNLEQISTQKRCCWTFPNLFFLGQTQGSKEKLINKKKYVYKTEHGENIKRAFEVNSQANSEDGIKYLYLPRHSAVIQKSWDHKTPQGLSSEVNLKQTFSSVHGLFSLCGNPTCPSPPIMPTHPEDVQQPTEAQHSILSSPVTHIQESPAEAPTCNAPSIVLPEYTVTPDAETEKNLALRPVSPHRRHSSRHARTSVTSLTSVDDTGHVIDLVNDELPEVKMSDEDIKKNLELLEEAKRVSEQFLTRRGRKSRSSLSESPTGLSPALSPSVSPVPSRSNSFTLPSSPGADICASPAASVSPLQNATKGLITNQKDNDQRKISQGRLVPRTTSLESPKEKLSEQKEKEKCDPCKLMDNLSQSPTSSTDNGRLSVNGSTSSCESELGKVFLKKQKESDSSFKGPSQQLGMVTVDPKLKGSVLLLKDSNVSYKTEINTSEVCTPLSRGVLRDHAERGNIEKAPFKPLSEDEKNFAISNKSSNPSAKPLAFKDLQIQVQPIRMQKLTKLREEHILMRNQNLVGLKLPDLSEAAEQERGSSPIPFLSEEEEEPKNKCDVMPNIPDTLLRKLRVHTSLPGSSPPLTEREVENVFVQLSLAFRNDSYTLESRISQAERERNIAEENTEKELNNFKAAITSSASLWHHSEHREMYQKLLEDIAVLHRLASRLSSRAEMVGAVRQEKRMSKATEVMMQYVENLKRTYEKDHAELMEYKKLASQNSSRSYGSPEDGVPRTSRSMSLSVGKMPRRRVSVAVVSKFELPGQSPGTSPTTISLMSSPSESSNGRSNLTLAPVLPVLVENVKSNGDPDCEPPSSVQSQTGLEDINLKTKVKIEEEAYDKGYQEGLKKTKELEELKEDDKEKIEEIPNECVASENEISKEHSKFEVIIHYVQILYPKLHKHWNVLWIVAAIIIIFALVLGISTLYSYFSSCTELSNGPKVKATCSAVQHYSWWNSGLQHDQRTE